MIYLSLSSQTSKKGEEKKERKIKENFRGFKVD